MVIIKANKKLFKSMTVIIKYVKTLPFGENCLMIQIQTIENCKAKIFIYDMLYTRLATNFCENKF